MTFHHLEEYHADLERMFALHQAALLERRFGDAFARLAMYEKALARHMRDEESQLFPLYEKTGHTEGGTTDAFRSEHRKLESLLAAIKAAVLDLHDDLTPARLIALIEQEARFKSLKAHHGLREHNVLYEVLDREIPREERARILGRCSLRVPPAELAETLASSRGSEEPPKGVRT